MIQVAISDIKTFKDVFYFISISFDIFQNDKTDSSMLKVMFHKENWKQIPMVLCISFSNIKNRGIGEWLKAVFKDLPTKTYADENFCIVVVVVVKKDWKNLIII